MFKRDLLIVWSLVFAFSISPISAAEPAQDFDRVVAPLLAARCLDCHQGKEPRGGLDLSRKEKALAGGESGAVIVPGKPADSLLWQHVSADEMPPKKPLSAAEKKVLQQWIASGAMWGTDPIDPFRFSTESRAGYDWWSLRPIVRPALPDVKHDPQQPAFIRNEIDRFVLAKLQAANLSPSPAANSRTLIRRVTFDLIGLPPTAEEVEVFGKRNNRTDGTDATYETLIQRLLQSPHYGERWARHWLDVVRFGESDGFERNAQRPNAWPYRDWVIRALNNDLPYDQFCRLQIAGDVFEPKNMDAIKATGFLVAGVHNKVLGNDLMRVIARQDELEETVGNVAQTFLGLTANCGRCHDHKFDPISQQDYYRLASALSGVQHGERELSQPQADVEIKKLSAQIEAIATQLAALEQGARHAALAERHVGKKLTAPSPESIAAWDLRQGLQDQVGTMHLKAVGDVKLTSAGASVAGTTFLRSEPLAKNLREKTLEAWVRLDNLTQQGGGVISLQTKNGGTFDAIVFGEKETQHWMAGSNGFSRTKSYYGTPESDAANTAVHLAFVYAADGTIIGYRQGVPYGKPYLSSGLQGFVAQEAVVILGCRHEPAGGNRMLAGTIVQARLYDRALTADEVETSAATGGDFVSEKELVERLSTDDRLLRATLRDDLNRAQEQLKTFNTKTKFTVYTALSQQPADTHLLQRGDATKPAEVVAPGGVAAVLDKKYDFGLSANAPEAERRKRLAEWITHPENPLFARVIVNRLWHHHFGVGLVETPNDLGFSGGRPSHPELLDWLASELIAKQFRLKEIHRLIVTSGTYRQASAPRPDGLAKDAESRLLWRKRPQRMEGEVLRDAMLSVAGLLNPVVGGKGFSDYEVVDAKNGTLYYEPFDPVGPEFNRRSVYRFLPRSANQGLLDLFDCPDPAAAAPRRNSTTTPLQALSLWNSAFALRMAESLSTRIETETGGTESQLEQKVVRAYRLTLQRSPTPNETAAAQTLVSQHGLRALCRVLLNTNEFLTID